MMHDVLELARRVAARLGAADGVEAVALGGAWAYPDPPPDAALDLYVYYRAEQPPAPRALMAALHEAGGDDSLDLPSLDAPGGGPLTWVWVEGRRCALYAREVGVVERAIEAGLAGILGRPYGSIASADGFHPTLMGEVHDARPLYDPLGLLAELRELTEPLPYELRRVLLLTFDDEADRMLYAAQHAAGQGDLYLAASTLARGVACLVQVIFAANGRYVAFDRSVLPRLHALPDCPPDAAGVIARALGAVPAPGALDDRIEDVRALAGEIRLRLVQPHRAGS